MMNIPYDTLVTILEQSKEKKPKSFFTRKYREYQIKKIIHILQKSIEKPNRIYKDDIVVYFNFMQQVESIFGNLKEFNGESFLKLRQIDNTNIEINYAFEHFRVDINALDTIYVTLRTVDTVNTNKSYFSYIETVDYEYYPERVTRMDLLYLECNHKGERREFIGFQLYKAMIQTIMQYLHMLLL